MKNTNRFRRVVLNHFSPQIFGCYKTPSLLTLFLLLLIVVVNLAILLLYSKVWKHVSNSLSIFIIAFSFRLADCFRYRLAYFSACFQNVGTLKFTDIYSCERP